MAKRLTAAVLLALFSLGILLFPWAGNYQSPLMWARQDQDTGQPIDVFLIGATADLVRTAPISPPPICPKTGSGRKSS